jgi:hypothetical protein
MDELETYVRSQLGPRAVAAEAWRVNDLTRLCVRFWPHDLLDEASKFGTLNHRDIDHALTLMRAQVRERWEAENGISPLWDVLLSRTVTAISHVLLGLWWGDRRWAVALRQMR